MRAGSTRRIAGHCSGRCDEATVHVEASARLHLGMLDAAGGGARRFGGVGVAVTRPAVVLEARHDDELSAEGPDAERALAFARRCQVALGLRGGGRLKVVEAIPEHVGLGSGTKLALAVATALTALHGSSLDPPALARAAGRGARSAVGLWTFALGGLVVEGGVRRTAEPPAPLLARHAVPAEWCSVLAIPPAQPGLSGSAEEEAFEQLVPPRHHAAFIAQLMLASLLPALVEADVTEFGAALTRLQRLVGESFAAAQGGVFHPRAAPLVDALLRAGAAGAGQSSWGPAVYGIAGSLEEGRALAHRLTSEVGDTVLVEVVGFLNHGAKVDVTCNCS